jgi:hypothetical protein
MYIIVYLLTQICDNNVEVVHKSFEFLKSILKTTKHLSSAYRLYLKPVQESFCPFHRLLVTKMTIRIEREN